MLAAAAAAAEKLLLATRLPRPPTAPILARRLSAPRTLSATAPMALAAPAPASRPRRRRGSISQLRCVTSSSASSSSMPQRRGQQPSSPPAGPRPAAAVRDRLQERRIFLERYNAGQHRAVCPECNGGSSQERSLAVRIDANGVDAVWNCFRGTCGWTGGTSSSPQAQAPAAAGRRGPPASPPPQAAAGQQAAGSNKVQYHMAHRLAEGGVRDPGVLAFFRRRGIAAETLRPSIVRHERAPAPGAGGAAAPPTVAFVYTSGGRPANIKFRSLDTKRFWQVAGAEKLLYGLDDISPGAASGFDGTVIIVEGEMDKLSCDQAGMAYCVSVPDGAPRQVREGSLPETKEEDAKFEYVWNCRRQLD